MSLPVMTYEHHSPVQGGADFFDALQAFAKRVGWSIVGYLRNMSWGIIDPDSWGWIAGDESFLQIQSTGYGNQRLGYEFRLDPYDSRSDMIEWAMYKTENNVSNNTLSLHPIEQTALSRNNYPSDGYALTHWVNFPAGRYPDLWLFGTDKYVLAVNRVSVNGFICFSFGTLVLASEYWERVDCGFWWPACYDALGNEEALGWWNVSSTLSNWGAPFAYAPSSSFPGAPTGSQTVYTGRYGSEWLIGEEGESDDYTQSCSIVPRYVAGAWEEYGTFVKPQYGIGYNSWSSRYVPVSPIHYVSAETGGTRKFFPVGHAPIAWIPWTGTLEPGEEVLFGHETHMAFPLHSASSEYGFLVRIA